MNRRWLCGDIWMNILPFFDYAKLGLKIALLSDRYDVLVDIHFDGKKEFTLWRCIKIGKDEGPKGRLSVQQIDGTFVEFPIPDYPFPNKIRFRFLLIEYIDHSVIAFLRSNKQIWDRMGTKLEFNNVNPYIWDVLAGEIWPIFATNIRHLCFEDGAHLDNLRRHISPTLLTDLDQLNSIDSGYLFPDGNAPNSTAGQALAKWLQTPTKNGQPKELRCSHNAFMKINNWFDNHKQAFLRATTSVSYNMRITFYKKTRPIPFEFVNERTNEKLTLTKERDYGDEMRDFLMKRCPIIEETTALQWQNDENLDHLNGVVFRNAITGELFPPDQSDEKVFSTPGPSDQQK